MSTILDQAKKLSVCLKNADTEGALKACQNITIRDKIDRFAALLYSEQHAELLRKGYNPEHYRHDVWVHYGKKFIRVDVGDSGKYMVDIATQEIFGIKGYGVIHRGHRFGTLDTIADWQWGDYTAIRKAAV